MLSNILQVKERGATTVVFTNLSNITKHIERSKLDFLVQLPVPNHSSDVFAALLAVLPLQMVCYLTSVRRGLDPDRQIFESIDFAHSLV